MVTNPFLGHVRKKQSRGFVRCFINLDVLSVAEKKMAITLESLVYWESPAHSAAVCLPTLAVFAALSARYIYSGLKGTVA
jgi:hypothetical protein